MTSFGQARSTIARAYKLRRDLLKTAGLFFLLTFTFASRAAASDRPPLASVPAEIASTHFLVTIDGQSTPVMHAAVNLYFLNFVAGKHARITVTAPTDDFWNAGIDVQPWRFGIRPERHGRTISFVLNGPSKITIARPNDTLGNAEMLYLFANSPEQQPPPTASRPGLHYFGPGLHTENIDAVSGEAIYLAPGAVVMGSLNIWQVDHVKVFGTGVIVYVGPQNPADDDGWMHKRNWHCITMDHAHDISISDLTCVVRSRTWQIQMKDSNSIIFDNVKVIGANAGNANADGMDWLGGGDTVVRNSFFRAADDVFAMQSSWEGYGPQAFAVQGEPVRNISIESTLVSTSISNIVRVGWPAKNFEGGNLRMKDIDVLHAGIGGCGVPFAFMELWADPDGRGQSADYSFTDIRLDDWYSLLSIAQPTPVTDIHFMDIASLRAPATVPSRLEGAVNRVTLDNVVFAGKAVRTLQDLPLNVNGSAAAPVITDNGPQASLHVTQGWLKPKQKIRFEAIPASPDDDLHYTWIFGDGNIAHGRKVKHRFPDADGTMHDESGLFDVLLHITNDAGRETWIAQPVVVREQLLPAMTAGSNLPGVAYTLASLDDASQVTQYPALQDISGTAPSFDLNAVPHPADNYRLKFSSILKVPEDGGYVFTLIANEASSFTLDGELLATNPAPFPQVCGLQGDAARLTSIPVELARGSHRLVITEEHRAGTDNFQVLWQGPGIPVQPLPAALLSQP